jgi:hypothetical protein
MSISKRIHAQRAAGRIAFGSASNADPILGAIDRRGDAQKTADIRRSAPAVAATVYGLFVDLEPREGRE